MAPASSGAGYSGTPLGKKLSLKPGLRVWFDAMPGSVLAEIDMSDLVHLVAPLGTAEMGQAGARDVKVSRIGMIDRRQHAALGQDGCAVHSVA